MPSRAGLSHVPEEWTEPAQLAVGTDLLLASLLRLDARTAAALSDGGRLRSNGALLRAAASAEAPIRQAVERRRAHLNTAVEARRG